MQPVEKSGQSEQTGFLNQDGNSCERVSHGNRIRERKAALQYLGVQLNNCVCWGGGLLSGLYSNPRFFPLVMRTGVRSDDPDG